MIFILTSTLLIEPEFFRNSVTQENLNIKNYIIHIFMLQGFTPSNLHSLLDGSWSIVNEVYFYILFPIVIHKYTKTPESALAFFIISLIISAVFMVLIFGDIKISSYRYYAFPVQLPAFILGIYSYRLAQSLNMELTRSHTQLLFLSAIVLFLYFSQLGPGAHIVSCILFAIVMVFVKINLDNGFNGPVWFFLRSLGKQSYALFFIHLILLKLAYTHFFSINKFSFIIMLIVNIAISIAMSFALSKLIFNKIDIYFLNKFTSKLISK
jgi:peptidoglycan/LPS O-acetylase OafA/YrhL